MVKISGAARRVTIYIVESDRWHGMPLYHAIVLKARETGMAGATVIRAIEGFGATQRVHAAHLTDLSSDLPVVVEVIDSVAHIEHFLQEVDPMMRGGLITVEDIQEYVYRAAEK